MATSSRQVENCRLSLIAKVALGRNLETSCFELLQSYFEASDSDFELVIVANEEQHQEFERELAGFSFISWSVFSDADSSYSEQIETALALSQGSIIGLLPTTECFLSPGVIPDAIRVLEAFPEAAVIVPSYVSNSKSTPQLIEKYNFFQDESLQPAAWTRFQELPQTLAPVFFSKHSLQTAIIDSGDLSELEQLQFYDHVRQHFQRQRAVFLLPAEAAVARDWQIHGTLTSASTVPRLFGQFGRQVHSSLYKIISNTADTDLPYALEQTSGSLLDANKPKLSLLVVAYDMQQQLPNTIASLSADYQLGVKQSDYEVLLIENDSDRPLDSETRRSLPGNFRYFLREELSQSPAAAINFGLAEAKGEYIGLMVDAAHMLTPGVLHTAMIALRLSERPFVTVPTYHLGPDEQHLSTQQGYNEEQQQALLDDIDWQSNGYALFSISSLCGANPRGFLAPIMESNCYFASQELFTAIGGADERYQQAGGGSLNLDLVRKLGIYPEVDYLCLLGEGSFHQFHAGVTSNKTRAEFTSDFKEELHERWNQSYHFLERNPLVIGSITRHSRKYLEFSSYRMLKRFDNFKDRLDQVWSDDK